ncbi:MAG: TapB family protein [Armatimonadota bacterium]
MRIYRVVWVSTMALLLGLGVVGCGGGSSISSQYGTVSFLPLAAGNTWVYEAIHYNTTAPELPILATDSVTYEIGAPDGGAFPLRITSASQAGTATTQSVKWDGNNLLKLAESYAGAAYSYQPPIVLLKNGVGDDAVWVSNASACDSVSDATSTISTTFEMMGYESVATAAGSFTALKVKSYATTGGFYAYQVTWYAQGVGIVKMENYVNSPVDGDPTLSQRYLLMGYSLAN